MKEFYEIEFDPISGTSYNNEQYLKDYVKCAISSICDANKRNNPMTDSDKEYLAEDIIELGCKRDFTIEDIALWASEVNKNHIGTFENGREEFGLKAVDRSSLYGKFESYDKKRSAEKFIIEQERKARADNEIASNRPLSQWQKTHDYEGHDMTGDPNWNAEHYWHTPPTDWELDNIIYPRIMNKLKNCIHKV